MNGIKFLPLMFSCNNVFCLTVTVIVSLNPGFCFLFWSNNNLVQNSSPALSLNFRVYVFFYFVYIYLSLNV